MQPVIINNAKRILLVVLLYLVSAKAMGQDSTKYQLLDSLLIRIDSALQAVNELNKNPQKKNFSSVNKIERLNVLLQNRLTSITSSKELLLLLNDFKIRSEDFEKYLDHFSFDINASAFGTTSFQNRILLYHTDLLQVKTALLGIRNNYTLMQLVTNFNDEFNSFSDSSRLALFFNRILRNYNLTIENKQILMQIIDTAFDLKIKAFLEKYVNVNVTNTVQTPTGYHWQDFTSFIGFSAWEHSILGLFYNYKISKSKNATPVYLGAEIVRSFDNAHSGNWGGYINIGLASQKLLLECGMGLLDIRNQTENISWKGGVSYLIKNISMGINYSPLTGGGLRIGVAFK